MISWRGVAKKRREPKLAWMKVKSSGTVAPEQQSWRGSNHFVAGWRTIEPSPPAQEAIQDRKKKEPVTCDRSFPLEYPLKRRKPKISARPVPIFHHRSYSPTLPTPPAPQRRWCRGIACWRERDGGLGPDARKRLQTEPWTRQSALTRQSSKSSSSFSSPLTQRRCEAWLSRACRAVFKASRDG